MSQRSSEVIAGISTALKPMVLTIDLVELHFGKTALVAHTSGLNARVKAQDVDTALFAYWTARADAEAAQAAKGALDVGGRAGATAGGHLDQIARLLADAVIDAGAPADQVFYKTPEADPRARANMAAGYTLPGHFRPDKQWDLVVWHKGAPIIVVELKSQNGPSYGNNANNRAEEAIGNAVDLRRAVQEGLFPFEPWVGYVFVMESDLYSELIRPAGNRLLPVDAAFNSWSYVSRIATLSGRLVNEGLYDSAWAVATSRPSCIGTKLTKGRVDRGKSCPILAMEAAQDEWLQKVADMAARGKTSKASPPPTPPAHVHAFGWHEPVPSGLGNKQFVRQMTAVVQRHYGPPAMP